MGWRLAVDFGTSVTTASTAEENGPIEMLVRGDDPHMPSAVFAERDGSLVVGRDAVHKAVFGLDRFLETPKRRVGEARIQLGENVFTPREIVAAVLGEPLYEAFRIHDATAPDLVVLTHPARWKIENLRLLRDAFQDAVASLPERFLRAGRDRGNVGEDTPAPYFMAEPIAAAHYFLGNHSAGSACAIYDLGGGTFDTSVVFRNPDGNFEVLASGGIENLGGEDFDDYVVTFVGEKRFASNDPETWEKLKNPDPDDPDWPRRSRSLRDAARMTKERLSEFEQASCPLPQEFGLDEVQISREEFDGLIKNRIAETIDELRATIDKSRSRLPPSGLDNVHLVGGSSRVPLVAIRLESKDEDLGLEVVGEGNPRQVVVKGALATPKELDAVERATKQWGNRAQLLRQPLYRWDEERHMPTGPAVLGLTDDHLLFMESDNTVEIPMILEPMSVYELPADELVDFEDGRGHFGGNILTIKTATNVLAAWYANSPEATREVKQFSKQWNQKVLLWRASHNQKVLLWRASHKQELNPSETSQNQPTPPVPDKEVAVAPESGPSEPATLVIREGQFHLPARFAIQRATAVSRKGTRFVFRKPGWMILPGRSPEEWYGFLVPRYIKSSNSVFLLALPSDPHERGFRFITRTGKAPLGTITNMIVSLRRWYSQPKDDQRSGAAEVPTMQVIVCQTEVGRTLARVVKAIVQEHATSWFELSFGIFLVDGLSLNQWIELFKQIHNFPGGDTLVFVVTMPRVGERSWRAEGGNAEAGRAWLRDNY